MRLRDVDGREHPFTEDTPLMLVQNDGAVITERYLDLRVDSDFFRGVPQDALRKNVEVPLTQVKSAGHPRARTSPGRCCCAAAWRSGWWARLWATSWPSANRRAHCRRSRAAAVGVSNENPGRNRGARGLGLTHQLTAST